MTSPNLPAVATAAFMALVTACTMAMLFGEASRGLDGATGILIYGATVAFGLEYLGATWSARWRARRR